MKKKVLAKEWLIFLGCFVVGAVILPVSLCLILVNVEKIFIHFELTCLKKLFKRFRTIKKEPHSRPETQIFTVLLS